MHLETIVSFIIKSTRNWKHVPFVRQVDKKQAGNDEYEEHPLANSTKNKKCCPSKEKESCTYTTTKWVCTSNQNGFSLVANNTASNQRLVQIQSFH